MIPPSEIPKVREDLLEYCKNDTAATLAILKELRRKEMEKMKLKITLGIDEDGTTAILTLLS